MKPLESTPPETPPEPTIKVRGTSRPSTVIGFRLEPELAEVLAQRAQALGVSSHELARHYLLEALHLSAELHSMVAGLTALSRELSVLRQDLALGVEALLASAGQVREKDARIWVESNLNRP